MKKLFLSIILLSILFNCSFIPINASTYDEPYTIEIPKEITISDTNCFKIKIKENNLTNNQTLIIDLPKTFTMNDVYGKESVNGIIINNHFELTNIDTNDLQINYQVDDMSSGEWSSNLNVSISLQTSSIKNMMIDGDSLKSILVPLSPKQITFSKDKYISNYENINGKPYIDISVGQDESVLLYKSTSTGYTITSNGDSNLYANYDCSNMFGNLISLSRINNINELDTTYTNNMANMFDTCTALTSIDISTFDTSSVTDMSYMFNYCTKLATITGLSNIDTSNVTNMSYMFCNTGKLKTGIDDVSHFSTNNVTNMSHMFDGLNCDNKTSSYQGKLTLDLSSWNMNNVNDLSYFVSNCIYLKELILPTSISNVTNLSYMFSVDHYLEKVNANDIKTDNVTDTSYMFYRCNSLTNPGNISTWNMANVDNMEYMFNQAWNMNTSLSGDLNKWAIKTNANKTNMFVDSNYDSSKIKWY